MTRVILVPGINTDNTGSIFRLVKPLQDAGFEVVKCCYEHRSMFDTFSKRKSDENARELLRLVQSGDHVIAHSNGCRVTHRAMALGAVFDQAYLFGAAFGCEVPWPKLGARKINVIHNKRDKALRLGWLVPRHDFGLLGAIGYQGPLDTRIHSFSTLSEYDVDKNDHSFWANPEKLALCARYLTQRLEVVQ